MQKGRLKLCVLLVESDSWHPLHLSYFISTASISTTLLWLFITSSSSSISTFGHRYHVHTYGSVESTLLNPTSLFILVWNSCWSHACLPMPPQVCVCVWMDSISQHGPGSYKIPVFLQTTCPQVLATLLYDRNPKGWNKCLASWQANSIIKFN